jgi:RNase P subunit RPR2
MYVRGIQSVEELSHYAGISERLAREYVQMYKGLKKKPSYRVRIEDLLKQLSCREVKKGAIEGVGQ